MVKKSLAALTLALCAAAGSALAEQPAANEYREIFRSGTFYVEYSDKYFVSTLAAQNNMRMKKSAFKLSGAASLFANGKKSYPDFLYRDGKYYKFDSKKSATMALWNQLNDPNIDPKGGWNGIQNTLAVPEELAPLCPYDAYRGASNAMIAPVYVESGKKTVDKKDYDYDLYTVKMKNQAGGTLAEVHYVYCYEQGKLALIEKLFLQNGQESRLNSFKVKELSGEIPAKTFDMPAGLKVYAVGIGDMNDLIEQPVQVESY